MTPVLPAPCSDFRPISCRRRQFTAAVLRRVAGDGRDRRHASCFRAGARCPFLYCLSQELFSIWTPNWLLWFSLMSVGFVLFSPSGLAGVWTRLNRRWRPPPEEAAAMGQRRLYEALPLPGFLRSQASTGTVLEVSNVSKHFGGIQAVSGANLCVPVSGEIHALIGPNGAGKTTLFNLISSLYRPDTGTIRLSGRDIHGLPVQGSMRSPGAGALLSKSQAYSMPRRSTRISVYRSKHAIRVGLTFGATLIVIPT